MKLIAFVSISLASCVTTTPASHAAAPSPAPTIHHAPTPLAPGMTPARPDQLNSKHHLLRVGFAGELLAVGATIVMDIPARLGEGHGPFARVYPGPGTVAASASVPEAVTIVLHPAQLRFDDPSIEVTCKRAGVFALAIDITDADGNHVRDDAELVCVAPTRFVVETFGDPSSPYLAQASTIDVRYRWFGRVSDGSEHELVGALPVELAPGETAVARSSGDGATAAFRSLHTATSATWISAGLVATMPVEIVEQSWKLEIAFETPTTRRGWIADARAIDARGRAIAGLVECRATTYVGGTAATHDRSCRARLVPSTGQASRIYWPADRICFTVRDQTVCAQVPDRA